MDVRCSVSRGLTAHLWNMVPCLLVTEVEGNFIQRLAPHKGFGVLCVCLSCAVKSFVILKFRLKSVGYLFLAS